MAELGDDGLESFVLLLGTRSLLVPSLINIKEADQGSQSMEDNKTSSIKNVSTKSVSSISGSSSGGYVLRSRSSVVVSNSKVPTSGFDTT